MLMNSKLETWSISTAERRSFIITFIQLNPVSHSAVKQGIVLSVLKRGFNFCVTCLPPLSLKSQNFAFILSGRLVAAFRRVL